MNGAPQPCNLFALAQGVDPIGYAGTFDAFLAFELPLPWPRGVFELPTGRLWAYLDEASAATLMTRELPAGQLRGHYRGRAALEGPFLQALERELLVREGWGWLARRKRGVVLERDPAAEPLWQRVRIDAEPAGGGHDAGSHDGFEALVELQRHVSVRPRTDSPELLPYAQYRVTSLTTVPGRPAVLAP